ncbi:MAG: 30S ribosomal protein S8e [Candidatus Marsarchaeota archaeon]|jgi:Ribosomal protein S8E|nr:30S ribosomal protein S8e [Candidatus Marsarchaeota archaeon]
MSQFGSQFHGKSGRKLNGSGKIKLKNRDKRRHEMGGYFVATKLGQENQVKMVRCRGGGVRSKLTHAGLVNLQTKEGYKKAKIRTILESKDNRNFARLNIITKGSVIDTEFGKAVVTNRPGKEGCINARLT